MGAGVAIIAAAGVTLLVVGSQGDDAATLVLGVLAVTWAVIIGALTADAAIREVQMEVGPDFVRVRAPALLRAPIELSSADISSVHILNQGRRGATINGNWANLCLSPREANLAIAFRVPKALAQRGLPTGFWRLLGWRRPEGSTGLPAAGRSTGGVCFRVTDVRAAVGSLESTGVSVHDDVGTASQVPADRWVWGVGVSYLVILSAATIWSKWAAGVVLVTGLLAASIWGFLAERGPRRNKES
jgi:hypothetical protein